MFVNLIPHKKINCTLCGNSISTLNIITLESHCIFGGGKLIRYKCQKCDVIFGPTKFLKLSPFMVAMEYKQLYRRYTEGDTTKYEIRAFKLLNPNKKKKYLNYGSGLWSKSIELLRSEGWDICGYEPYAKNNNIKKDYIFSSKEDVSKHKFDGIFSHNVIEHLFNPMDEFHFMKSILANNTSRMSHSTACYKYMYEYSIFHVHFYTGRSIDYVARNIGMKISKRINDKHSEFKCRIFKFNGS